MEYGIDAPKYLDGMFSFVLYDKKLDRTIAARDPIGITTFYQGWSSKEAGATYFGSELKCLFPVYDKIEAFPPGHIYDSKPGERSRYFQPSWWDPIRVPDTPLDLKLLRESLERSVRKRLMAEVPYGVLLSGGLDSSLVASIAQRESLRLKKMALDANGAPAPPRQRPRPRRTWTAARAWWASTTTTNCRRSRTSRSSTPSPSACRAPLTTRPPSRWPSSSAPSITS